MRYTRFERARIIGARALQISMGAPSLMAADSGGDPLEIAFSEFASGTAPLNVQRFRDAFD
ncbi:MAG TPA: DNA-directed RNA polymerase subunit K [Thermoplasmata archaeon]|nr:MAG: DNA-directed RNA polymerase subunit K [Euryarchaeota archaeon]HYS73753.1 DNA-directed RNA polymerase subunit K [Thermoplasmata archaeon]